MRILYVTTIGLTMGFFRSIIGKLVNLGNVVDIACNESNYKVDSFFSELGCTIYPLSCVRTPLSFKNFTGIKELKNIVKNGNYDIVHCHTPIASVITRLACKAFKKEKNYPKVIYTAHGFHFYKGVSFLNWLFFYPIEKMLSKYTDCLITINKEDYRLAMSKFKAFKVEYVPGVGVDIDKFAGYSFTDKEKKELKYSLKIPENSKILLSVGELNSNKNHETVIKTLAKMFAERPELNLYYIIAGEGNRKEDLLKLIKSHELSKKVKLLGYRKDVISLYKISDLFIHPSLREGLPVAVMEALASGLPVIASKIRGNSDLISEKWLFKPTDENEIADKVNDFFTHNVKYEFPEMEPFSKDKINSRIVSLYSEIMNR